MLSGSGAGTSLYNHIIRVWKTMAAISKPVLGIVQKALKPPKVRVLKGGKTFAQEVADICGFEDNSNEE